MKKSLPADNRLKKLGGTRLHYSWFVAWRHLRKRKGFFVNLSTFLSIAGIVVGVMALNITISVMNGFDADLKDKILGMQPHILIFNEKSPIKYRQVMEKIGSQPHGSQLRMAPLGVGQGIISNGRQMIGVEIKGIDPRREGEVTNFPGSVSEGEFSLVKDEVLIGKELAKNLGLGLGGECSLVSGFPGRMKKFRISGIFDTGLYAFDSGLAYISLQDAQGIFGLKKDEATTIGIKVGDIYSANRIASLIQVELKYPYVVRSWDQLNRNLFSALKMEKTTMFILLSLIILVAGFGIANTMVMNVMQKVREIGIIQSLGANPRMVKNIFLLEGSVLGLIGISLGSFLGFVGCKLLEKYEFIKFPGDVYYISALPVQMRLVDFTWVGVLAFLIVLVFSIYPSHVASRIKPAEALKQEQ